MSDYQAVIIGAGPAGCSAALTLKNRNISSCVLYAGGGSLEKAHRIDNYPGLVQMGGKEMSQALLAQLEQAGIETKKGLVRLVQKTRRGIQILVGDDIFSCDSVLLATGMTQVQLIEGEEGLVGSGVSYCATCDGMLYKGKKVAVIAGPGFEEDVDFLRSICEVDRYAEKASKSMAGDVGFPSRPQKLIKTPEGVRVICADGKERDYAAVFIFRRAMAADQMVPGIALQDGHFAVDEQMMTNLEGIFAAGDAVGLPHQAAKAAGDGNIAALSMARYLKDKAK